MEGGLIDGIQQQPEMIDLLLKRLGAPFPLLELFILGLEPIDLFKCPGIGTRSLQSMTAKDGRHRCGLQQRSRQVDELIARIDQEAMPDAAQDQEDGTQEIEREGKQFDRPPPSVRPWPER